MSKKYKITKENIHLTLYPTRLLAEIVVGAGLEVSLPSGKLPFCLLTRPLESNLARARKAEWN